MTSLTVPTPVAATIPTTAPPVFGLRIIVGLVGVLVAVLVSGLNETVTKVALADIRGALGIGYDEGTWLVASYTATSVAAMAFAPWCSVTFSLRRFTLWAISLFTLLGMLCPFAPNYESLLLLRTLQGLAGGALPPMLMTVALRFLPANVKLYGLAGYALTATFGPGLGTPLAGLWTEYVGWQWTFWQIVVPCLIAMLAVAYGLPQDPLRLERLKSFNWRGVLLGFPAICMLVIGILQGNRLDWFESNLICALLGGGALLLVAFLINEWSQPIPFFKLQMLGIRNLSFALLTLAGVLVILQAVIILPSGYLAQVQGYRPVQTAPIMLLAAVPQLIALPLVAALCNFRWVDCRWVLGIGLSMLALSCVGGSQLTSAWIRDDFYVLQWLQIFGQPMAVLPLLMLATGSIHPTEGPFASAWFNTVRGLAAVMATGVIDVLTTRRLHFHSTMLVDSLGNSPLAERDSTGLAHRLHEQALVLTSSDLYLCMAAIAVVLILLIFWLPTRMFPPRAPT
ncbi:MFS transporter [Pseudomonas vancouverensis]|uniref:MFS transporter n=1 Tax=Pseudomonas vancouverensis TaxID=95300 RepID=A0A1H2PCR5_PSEVA|nr:MFS transporter [Pseudomonas vancouverensis]KAB0493621.1 multidrug efflux MFS transporter [Pseudomonas vancouverensis]TDB67802.1 MFS transporter [Pseudomonas vancouverensis]SDV15507.1 MFS transporter, DHA2 family, multidrug resistance protein [Pseudomonas vancouverensis]